MGFPEICALVTRDPSAEVCVPKGVKGEAENTQSVETKQMVRLQAHLKGECFEPKLFSVAELTR